MGKISVKQVKSAIKKPEVQKRTLEALGLRKLNQVVDKQKTGGLPRIEIRPVVFQGTYDEKNWCVLRDRWDDLRAQLHGVVISSRIAEKYSDVEGLASEINSMAPNFSPGIVGDSEY